MTTQKKQDQFNKKVIKQATIWLEKYNKEQVAFLVWNKLGYPSEVKNGELKIWGGHKVIFSE